jgi:hypothetical protein
VNTAKLAQPRAVPESLRALLAELIDYAGLFPPAALGMKAAVENYARYLDGEHAWMLAHFVVPASRLPEFERAQSFPPVSSEWKLSALLGSDPAADIEQIAEFNLRNAGHARVDSVETRTSGANDIRLVDALLPSETIAYFEFAPDSAPELIAAIREIGGRAKVRTGGLTPDAIPSPERLAAFMAACARAEVPFKATAGLHHPLRSARPLTYEDNAPVATMHGFLNVFLSAALVFRHHQAVPEHRACVQLSATSPELEFTDDAATIRIRHDSAGESRIAEDQSIRPAEARIPTAHIRSARQNFAISFGSCSFEEPIIDLRELKLL